MRNRTGGQCRLEEAFRQELFRLINQYLSVPEGATLGTTLRILVTFQQVSAVIEAYDSTLVMVADGRLLGAFAVEDEIRPESHEAVAELHQLGIQVAMITGDSKTVADSVAHRIGIDE